MRSINQVRHFYVATAFGEAKKGTTAGTLEAKAGNGNLVFRYVAPGDNLESSDVIAADKVLYAVKTSADNMKTALKKTVVTFKDSPIAGQEYIVKVTFTGYAGAGDANYTVKYGFATADSEIADNTALAKALADSLNKNLKDLVPLATAKAEGETLVIKEVEQPWEAGVKSFCVIPFEVSLMPIINKGVETVWGDVKTSDSSDDGDIIINGKKIADAEWFHSGARGDMYRGFGYPHSVKTKLLANEATAYDTLDIHYAYVGPNEGAQKSEKTITIAYPVSIEDISTLTTALSTAGIEVVTAPTKG